MIAAKYRLFSPEPKTSKFPRYAHTEEVAIPGISILGRHAISPGWSLALIGNASGTVFGRSRISIRGVFDEETRRKPLVFAADAGSYGI
jgi:hypothetical protein